MNKYLIYSKLLNPAFKLGLFTVFLFFSALLQGANRYSVASGNWNSTSTWSSSSGGASGASYPVAGDVVYIENGHTVTVTENAGCTSITFTGASATLTVNSGYSLSVSGGVTLNKQSNANSGCTVSGSGTLSCASVTVGTTANAPPGDFGGNTRTHTFTSTISTFNVSGNVSINGYYALISYVRNGTFNLESGKLTIGGTLTTNANVSTATFSLASGSQSGTLVLNGSPAIATGGLGISTFNFNGTSSTVIYSYSGAQTVYATTYQGLTLAGSGTKALGSVTVNGLLSMEGTAEASTAPTYGASSSLRYMGSSSQTTGSELPATFSGSGGVIIDNSSGVAMNSSLTVSNTLTLTSGALSIGANTLAIANSANISYGGGSLSGGSSSNLTIGTGSDLTLNSVLNGLNNLSTERNISLGGDLAINGTLTLGSGTFTVGSRTLTLNGPSVAGTPSNLSVSSASSLTFGGSSPGVEIPSGVTNLNNLTVNNSSGVTMTGDITIGSSGALTLSQGILDAGSHIIKITNSNQLSAIIWSQSAFVNISGGAIERTISPDLSGTGNSYMFPVGNSNVFKGLNLVDIVTGATGPVLRVGVSATGATTGDGVTIGPVDARDWYLGNTNGGNLTSSKIELYESGLAGTKTIGMAPAASGTYAAIGGSGSGSSVTSGIVLNPGPYFCIGTKINATYYSILSGNWNSSTSWSLSSGGTSGVGTPQAGDFVIIENPDLISVTSDEACASVTFTGTTTGLEIDAGGNLEVSGDIIQTKRANGASTATISGSGSLSCSNIIVGTSATSPTNDNTTRVHRINSTIASFEVSGNLTINSYYAAANRLRNGAFYLQAGTLSVAGTISTMNEDATNTSLFTMTQGDGTGTLILGAAIPFAESGTGTSNMRFNGTSATVIYNREGDQTPSTDAAYYNVTFSGSGIKNIEGVTVNGILSLEGTATASGTPTYRSASALRYKGSAAQVTGSELPAAFDDAGGIIIDNPSGVTLSNNLSIESGLSFIGGRLATGSNTLTITTGGTVTGAGSGSYVNGNLVKEVAAGTAAITFEIGDATYYTPVILEFTGTTNGFGDIQASTVASDHPSIATSAISSSFSVNRYWTLINNNVTGFTSCDATFTFAETDKDSYTEYDYFVIDKYLSSAWSAPSTGTRTATTVEATGLTTFGDFQAGHTLLEYRSISSGNWDQAATWETLVGTSWRPAPAAPDLSTVSITLQAPDVVTHNISSTIGRLAVNEGARLILANDLSIADGAGTDMTVNGILDCGGNYIVSGAGTFELGSTATIYIGSPDGISASGASGNIRTTGRSFSQGANYIYNGASAQVTGTALPETVSTLTVNNSSGLSLSRSTTIDGTLTLSNGAFSVGSNTLTLQNSDIPLSRTAGTLTLSPASSLAFGSPGNTSGTAFQLPSGTFTSAPEINNFTINRTNTLTLGDQEISVNGIVLCNGPLATNDRLTLLSTASGTGLIDGSGTGQVTGNVTMQRYLSSAFGYKYFSSPFQSATVSEFADDMDLNAAFTTFYRYDESRTSSGWVNYKTGTNVLVPMTGYAVNFGPDSDPSTADVKGTVNNGSLSLTLSNNNRTYTKGFNLVGNPYPSPIDWNAASGWNKTNIDNALYFFRASASDQYGGTNSTYINGVSSDGLATNIIPSMQGFFVHVSDGSYPVTAVLGMDNRVRITDKTHAFIKGAGEKEKSLIRISAVFSDNRENRDPFVIYLDEKAADEFDSRLDALKLFNTDRKVPNLYSLSPDGAKLSIDAIFTGETELYSVPLGLKLNQAGTVNFNAEDFDGEFAGKRVFLLDKSTGIEKELKKHEEYSVTLAQGEYINRFYLNLYASSTGIPEKPGDQPGNFSIYSSMGLLKADVGSCSGAGSRILITSLTGQVMTTYKIEAPGQYEFTHGLREGIYIATYVSGTTRESRKILIKP